MKSLLKNLLAVSIGIVLIAGNVGFAEDVDYGAQGASEKEDFTIEEMLHYAIQDEYLARAEYEKIIEVYGEQRPFTNIIKAEETHIALLKPLFETYGLELMDDTAKDHVVIPSSIEEALNVGIQVEIENIAMYEKFLEQELPEDIADTFIRLKNASENHLQAFERGVNRGGGSGGSGKGQRRGKSN